MLRLHSGYLTRRLWHCTGSVLPGARRLYNKLLYFCVGFPLGGEAAKEEEEEEGQRGLQPSQGLPQGLVNKNPVQDFLEESPGICGYQAGA